MKIKYKPWAKGLMYLVEAVVIILSVFPILWVVMSLCRPSRRTAKF